MSSFSDENIILTSGDNTSTQTNTITFNLPVPYISDGNDTISLATLSLYNSWYNLTSVFNNLTVAYKLNGTTYNITFPPGSYQVTDLNAFIQLQMKNNNHYLVDNNGNNVYFISLQLNPVYYCVTLTCTPIPSSLPIGWTNPGSCPLTGFTPLLLTDNSNWPILIGFAQNGTFPAVQQSTIYQVNSTLIPQITPITSINATCSWVNSSKFSRKYNVIQSFTSSGYTSGQLISFYPPALLFYKVVPGNYSNISVSFIDQLGRSLQMNDTSQIQIILILRSLNK